MNSQQVSLITQTRDNESEITQAEWQELVALKAAIDGYPQSISTCQQQRFTELMVKSLVGKGDRPLAD
jgi:ABC-type polar amino acid transport system ATPase subunit